MAFRKEKIREQYQAALPAVLEPGETVEAASYSVSGPSPWLAGGIGVLLMYILGMRNYYVAVTPRRVLFMLGSFWTGRPKGLAWADDRSQVSLTEVNDNKIWSNVRYQRPGAKPLRLNFHAWWKDEFHAIVRALSPAAGTAPGAAPGPVPPGSPA